MYVFSAIDTDIAKQVFKSYEGYKEDAQEHHYGLSISGVPYSPCTFTLQSMAGPCGMSSLTPHSHQACTSFTT